MAAVGSSFPKLSTVVVSTPVHGAFELLLGLYGLFVLWLGAEGFALVDLVPGLPPPGGAG